MFLAILLFLLWAVAFDFSKTSLLGLTDSATQTSMSLIDKLFFGLCLYASVIFLISIRHVAAHLQAYLLSNAYDSERHDGSDNSICRQSRVSKCHSCKERNIHVNETHTSQQPVAKPTRKASKTTSAKKARKEAAVAKIKVKALQAIIQRQAKEIKKLRNSHSPAMKSLVSRFMKTKAKCTKQQGYVTSLETKAAEAEALVLQMQTDYKQLKEQHEAEAKEQQETLEELRESLRNREEQLTSANKTFEDFLASTVAEADKQTTTVAELRTIVDGTTEQVKQLEAKRNEAEDAATAKQALISQIQDELTTSNRQLETSEARCKRAEDKLAQCEDHLEEAEVRQAVTEKRLMAAYAERDLAEAECKQHKRYKDDFRAELDEEKETFWRLLDDDTFNDPTDVEEWADRVDRMALLVHYILVDTRLLSLEANRQVHEILELKGERSASEERASELEHEVQRLRSRLQAVETGDSAAVVPDIDEVGKLAEENAKLRKENYELRAENNQLDTALLKEEMDHGAELGKLRAEHIKASNRIIALKASERQLQDLQAALDADTVVENLQRDLRAHERIIIEHMTRVKLYRQANASYAESINERDEQIAELYNQLAIKDERLLEAWDWLQELADAVEGESESRPALMELRPWVRDMLDQDPLAEERYVVSVGARMEAVFAYGYADTNMLQTQRASEQEQTAEDEMF